jgi:hypothetical protein
MQGRPNVDFGAPRRLSKHLDEAISIAARIPMARKGTVEIRPVIEIAGLPTD